MLVLKKRKRNGEDGSPIIIGDSTTVPPFKGKAKARKDHKPFIFVSHPKFKSGLALSVHDEGFFTSALLPQNGPVVALSRGWHLHPSKNLTIFSFDNLTVFFVIDVPYTIGEDTMTDNGVMLIIPGTLTRPTLVNHGVTTPLPARRFIRINLDVIEQ